MNETWGWLWTVLASVAGLVVGFLVCEGRARRVDRERKRIPKHWPLHSRVLANTEECKVWRWLSKVFYDHHIMIKIPVTRFTLPRSKESGVHWYQLLSGVYSTFTICAADGHVVGCVDVLRDNNLSRRNRHLKLTLLSQCGIAYCVVNSDSLPTLAEIRSEFLGETEPMPLVREGDETTITAAIQKLQAAIDRQRHSRYGELNSLIPDVGPTSSFEPESQPPDSEFGSGSWLQPNSFVAPLDSRVGVLD